MYKYSCYCFRHQLTKVLRYRFCKKYIFILGLLRTYWYLIYIYITDSYWLEKDGIKFACRDKWCLKPFKHRCGINDTITIRTAVRSFTSSTMNPNHGDGEGKWKIPTWWQLTFLLLKHRRKANGPFDEKSILSLIGIARHFTNILLRSDTTLTKRSKTLLAIAKHN